MALYKDLKDQLEYGKKAFESILAKDVPYSAAVMDGHCTFVCDWFKEDMPLENKTGDATERLVRKMIASSCHAKCPEIGKSTAPKEDILVFADQGNYVQRVLEKAPEDRIGIKQVVTKPARMITQDDVYNLLSKRKWDLVIFGCSVDPPRSNRVADIIDHQSNVCKLLFYLMQTIQLNDGCCKRLAVLTNDTFSEEVETHAKRGLEIMTHSYVFGMLNTARLELEIPVHMIDVELIDDYELLPHVASEIFRLPTFGVNSVRHRYPWPIRKGVFTDRPGGRFVVRQLPSHRYEKAMTPFDIPSKGIIAISGGNGALALVMGQWILDRAEKQIAASNGTYKPEFEIQFLSRSMKISDLNMPHWKKIEQKAAKLGVHVEQARLDMGTQEALDQYIRKVSPNLVGFIHSAGVLQDSMLPNQTWEKFESVFDSKHRAALYLHDSLERFSNPDLKFLWLFSSTSVYGNMGQINYSASNSALDGLARHRTALGKPCLAIQWGAWGEVGMAATMDETMRRRVMMGPMPYFTVAQGLQGLEGGLRTGLPGFSVFITNPPMMFGMIHSDASVTACYLRNFYSEYVPTPAPSNYDRASTYNIYRMFRYVLDPYLADGKEEELLVWSKYIKPAVTKKLPDSTEEEIEVDFL